MNFRRKGLTNLEIHLKGTLMSKNKIALSLAVAGILGASSALAETSAGFVGLQGNTGFGGHTTKVETATAAVTTQGTKTETSSYQFGILAGYKHFFVPKFGLRFYGLLDYANTEVSGVTTTSINADALFNFISGESWDLGGFGGVSLGYGSVEVGTATTTTTNGMDFGLNVGLRVTFAQHHGLELYSRIGLIGQEEKLTVNNNTVITRNKQDYIGGLRYIYSF